MIARTQPAKIETDRKEEGPRKATWEGWTGWMNLQESSMKKVSEVACPTTRNWTDWGGTTQ